MLSYKYSSSGSFADARSHDLAEEPTDHVELIIESSLHLVLGGRFALAQALGSYIKCDLNPIFFYPYTIKHLFLFDGLCLFVNSFGG